MLNNSLYGNFRTRTFSQIFDNAETFLNEYVEYENAISNVNQIENKSVIALYYLLYAKYGNWSIANADENQFKFKVWSTIFIYGPTWEKRVEIQQALRDLSEKDIQTGSMTIYNHSYDPGTSPSTLDTEELETVNDQNVNKYTRSKMDAYEMLYELLKVDVSKSFIDRFKSLFNPFAQPQMPLWYETDIEED